MLEQMSAAEAMKWVLLVFAAGFIGFFGKHLGKSVISAFQKKGPEVQVSKETQDHQALPAREKDREAKLAKKMMKARIKEQKKKSG